MVGMSGKRVLQESQLLNGYKGVTENDKRIQTTRDTIQTTSRTQYDTATTSRQACLRTEHDIQVATQGHNA